MAAFLGNAVELLGGRVGSTARVVATAGALGLLFVGYRVGHYGGELVYRHAAASAYVDAAATGVPMVGEGRMETR